MVFKVDSVRGTGVSYEKASTTMLAKRLNSLENNRLSLEARVSLHRPLNPANPESDSHPNAFSYYVGQITVLKLKYSPPRYRLTSGSLFMVEIESNEGWEDHHNHVQIKDIKVPKQPIWVMLRPVDVR